MVKRLTSVAVLLVLVLLPACGGTGTTGVPTPTGAAKPASTKTATTGGAAVATPLPTLTTPQIVQQLTPSTVMILGEFPASAVSTSSLGAGTGIVIDSTGDILTNAHVVDGASAIAVYTSGSTHSRPARLIGISPCDDLAIIKVDDTQGIQSANLGHASDQQVGESVVALGYPESFNLGNTISVSRGIISKLNQQLDPYENLIQTDASINHGNSGGPLVNDQGQVIGINTLGYSGNIATGLNFAISIDLARQVVPNLLNGQKISWLGMNLVENSSYGSNFGTQDGVGMVVAGVDTGGPADTAGVKPAYLMTQLAGIQVNTMADVCNILRSHTNGDVLSATFLDTNQQTLQGQITIGKPAAAANVKVVQGAPTPTAAAPTPAPTATGGTANVKTWDFSSDNGDWPTGDTSTTTVSISGGTYNVNFKQAGYYDVRTPKSFSPTGDQAIAADVNLKAGYAGVVVRFSATSDNKWSYYDCWIDGSGEYGCRVDVQDQFTVLVPTTSSSAIKNGQVNRLELDASGTSLDFYINGTKVTSFSDSHIQSGVVGLEAGSNKGQTPGSVSFGNVAAAPAQ
ncbi:MAG TPA: trypsin-like peptidase domain-containing protein [Thermomicrobiaceae bacterium]|nr:trypsin-like peptidase domain-containing protein [Thermomicrobiaceae bacterium]